MLLRRNSTFRRFLFSAVAIASAASILSCQSAAHISTTVASSPGLKSLQQAGFVKASLYGMAEFEFDGDTVNFPTYLNVPSVPVVWMGTIFSGKVEKAGPGQDTIIQVHGSTTEDGSWVNTLSYSKLVVAKGTGNVLSYKVSLRSIPITALSGQSATGTFEKKGSDLRKHVEEITYFQTGAPSGTQKATSTTYKSLDWEGVAGLEPILKLTFETVASENVSGTSGGGMM